MVNDLIGKTERASWDCKNPDCSNPAIPGSGYFPYCSKPCRDHTYYLSKAAHTKKLNAIRSEINRMETALAALYRKWPDRLFTEGELNREGIYTYGYHKRTYDTETKEYGLRFVDHGLVYHKESKNYSIRHYYDSH